jgi:hypothetical protein
VQRVFVPRALSALGTGRRVDGGRSLLRDEALSQPASRFAAGLLNQLLDLIQGEGTLASGIELLGQELAGSLGGLVQQCFFPFRCQLGLPVHPSHRVTGGGSPSEPGMTPWRSQPGCAL